MTASLSLGWFGCVDAGINQSKITLRVARVKREQNFCLHDILIYLRR
jgi:hypothetical protein